MFSEMLYIRRSVECLLATQSRSSAHRLTKATMSNSTDSSSATSASKRLISSKSSSKRSKRSNWATMSSLLLASMGSKLSPNELITSEAILNVVNGVLSSCETSETKRCCTRDKFSRRVICFSRDSAISLNAFPNVEISSCDRTFILCLKSPAVKSVAIRAASLTGLTTWRTTIQVIKRINKTKNNPVRYK